MLFAVFVKIRSILNQWFDLKYDFLNFFGNNVCNSSNRWIFYECYLFNFIYQPVCSNSNFLLISFSHLLVSIINIKSISDFAQVKFNFDGFLFHEDFRFSQKFFWSFLFSLRYTWVLSASNPIQLSLVCVCSIWLIHQ